MSQLENVAPVGSLPSVIDAKQKRHRRAKAISSELRPRSNSYLLRGLLHIYSQYFPNPHLGVG